MELDYGTEIDAEKLPNKPVTVRDFRPEDIPEAQRLLEKTQGRYLVQEEGAAAGASKASEPNPYGECRKRQEPTVRSHSKPQQ